MSEPELEVLQRAHQLFAGTSPAVALGAVPAPESKYVAGPSDYQRAANRSHVILTSAAHTDAAVTSIIAGARRDRAVARGLTGAVVDEARADATVTPATPLAQREALRRRVARLRAQRAHILAAQGRARSHAGALRALRYRVAHHGVRPSSAHGRADVAVRAALSRLGCPYVWGATGPHQFDCSGLVQWAYARAGVHLERTTYQQINDGIAVPRSQVQPGDLVFPHSGHVQMAIGNNLVVEAPYSGASVRISRLGPNVAIRRPW
ncbi:C40 family peptidase [Mycobacterium sp. TY814]|uniref:C40 family peptidase n=1 Tax=unclassified Mycobacterium TaxID=2642494 RepID=UPI000FA6C492|nr:C40 family peptidase [Mycobacterium sp. TY814]MDP7723087.1 C40 family peptidase [Mycobacterium sp. TY814]RUP07104.1 MAG: NlpC/P60 family protein [Mycobacterium sp.]